MGKQINVSLIGNPNTGKTSVFNQLTGLNQQVGNYPGITVEKKEGVCKLPRGLKAHILDLPGTYSLNASSIDESVVIELLLNKNDKDFPDVAVVVSDVENLKRNLLLFTQIKDLEIPTILVINMADRMKRKGISLDVPLLEEKLKSKVVLISARKGSGIEELKEELDKAKNSGKKINPKKVLKLIKYEKQMIELAKKQSFRNLKEICDENQTKYTDWIPLTATEQMAEDALQVPAPSCEQRQSMKDVFNIEVDEIGEISKAR